MDCKWIHILIVMCISPFSANRIYSKGVGTWATFYSVKQKCAESTKGWTHRKHNGGESHIMQIPSAARIIVPEDSVFAMALCKAYAKRFQLRVLSRTDRSKSSFVHFQRYCRRRSFGQSNIILATPTLYIDELNHISGVLCSRNDVRFWLALAILMSRYMFVRRDHRALCAKCEIWVRSS